jgi:hypothetical protein
MKANAMSNIFVELASKYKKDLQSLLRVQVEEFTKENPKYCGIQWDQYTPSFNDGEPCYATMSHLRLLLVDEEEGDGYIDASEFYGFTPEGQINSLISGSLRLMTWLFGNNKTITITAEAVTTEDYRE